MTTIDASHDAIAPARPRRPRIRILDGLRLVAALLVVSWHYIAFGHGASQTPYARVPLLEPIAAYGWLGVELFFLISGFVICMSGIGHTIGEFVTSRIIRLYPAYWFGVLLTTAVLLLWPVERTSLPLADVAVNLTMMQNGFHIGSVDSVYWTLWMEMHFYVLFAIVVWRGVTYRRGAWFCGIWLAAAWIGTQVGGRISEITMANWAPFFIAGVAFFLMHHYGQNLLLWGYIVASFIMGIHPVLRTLDGSNLHLANQIAQWPAVVIVGGFFVLMAAVALGYLRANWAWLGIAGALTYPLYLIHEFIGWALMKSLNDRVPGPLLYAGTIALMLAIAYLIHRFVEKPVAPRLRTAVQAAFATIDRVRHAAGSLVRRTTGLNSQAAAVRASKLSASELSQLSPSEPSVPESQRAESQPSESQRAASMSASPAESPQTEAEAEATERAEMPDRDPISIATETPDPRPGEAPRIPLQRKAPTPSPAPRRTAVRRSGPANPSGPAKHRPRQPLIDHEINRTKRR